MSILTNSTQVELWQEAVRHGEDICSVSLKEDLESYLVFLLMKHVNQPEVTKQILATKLFESLQSDRFRRHLLLQDVGDESLLFAGLFPQIAVKRRVKIRYFVEIGRTAYAALSQQANDLYGSLAGQFVILMDVLQSIRQYSKESADLLPLEAYEQWNTVGSQRALRILQLYSAAMPLQTHEQQDSLIYWDEDHSTHKS